MSPGDRPVMSELLLVVVGLIAAVWLLLWTFPVWAAALAVIVSLVWAGLRKLLGR